MTTETSETPRMDGGALLQDLLGRVTAAAAPGDYEGVAGGGAVRVSLRGMQRVSAVHISEAALEDRALLEELVAAAMNDALERARGGARETAGQLLAKLGDLPE